MSEPSVKVPCADVLSANVPSAYDSPLASCRLCDSKDVVAFDRDFRGHGIWRCRGCGVGFMNPQYSDGYLASYYAGYTFNAHGDIASTSAEGPKVRHRKRVEVRATSKRRTLGLIARYVRPGRLLMIGCGDGLELAIARELGWRVEGFDVDPESAERVARAHGVPVHHGRIEALGLEGESYDAIFMDQVLEHPKDPAAYLVGARRLLRPGGVLFLGTPNIGSLSNRAKTVIGRLGLREHKRGKHYATQHHLFYYSPGVLRRLLEQRYGFEVLSVRGSLKPQKRISITPLLSRWLPVLDSGFITLARRAEYAELQPRTQSATISGR